MEIPFDAFPEIIPQDERSPEAEAQPSPEASEGFGIDIVPRAPGIEEESAALSHERQSADGKPERDLIEKREPQFVAHQPEVPAPHREPVIPSQIPASPHEEPPGFLPVVH